MNEKLHQLFDLCLQIQQAGEGENGFPYISLDISNIGHEVSINIMDDGFSEEAEYSGRYELKFDGKPARRYMECENHLNELITKCNIKPIANKQCSTGTSCDADTCIHHDGNGRCGYDELYISDAETGDAKCLSAEFQSN